MPEQFICVRLDNFKMFRSLIFELFKQIANGMLMIHEFYADKALTRLQIFRHANESQEVTMEHKA